MGFVWNSAVALLVINGFLLGLSLPLGKIATQAGASAALWALVISGGAGVVLAAIVLARGGRIGLDTRRLRYFAIVAAVSYALPNLVAFSAISHVGAGYVGIMFTLSPVFTLALALLLKQVRPSLLGIAGIAVGFVGAMTVALTRAGGAGGVEADIWPLVALAIPLFLSVGNVYRTLDWPPGAGPLELAAGSHLTAALLLLVGLVATGSFDLEPLSGHLMVVAAQVVAAATMFGFFFRLQTVGGPVYLSQIGYVAAAVGLVSGTLMLGESYRFATWAGAAIIIGGVVLTTLAQARKR